MKGGNGSTSFLPLNKKGGLNKDALLEKYLTEDQTKYIYDKVELGDEIRVSKVCQETWNNKILPHKNLKGREEIKCMKRYW